MDLMKKLSHYLTSQAYPAAQRDTPEPSYPFVTISREAGAGGHSLANALLAEMIKRGDPLWTGWKVFDAAFCARILEDAKLMASLESLDKEETFSPWEEAVYELAGGRASSDRVFHKTFKAMKLLAALGKIIIIGRGGACATKDLPLGIHIRLVAPLPLRIQRMQEELRISAVNTRRRVDDYDLERAKFVRAHFGEDIRDPLLYDATWNTGRVSFEEAAHGLIEMIKTRAQGESYVRDSFLRCQSGR